MTNITLAIDEELLGRARSFAERKGTTLNAFVREQIAMAVDAEDRRANARLELKRLSEKSTARLGANYKFDREELYEERMFPRHEHSDLRVGSRQSNEAQGIGGFAETDDQQSYSHAEPTKPE